MAKQEALKPVDLAVALRLVHKPEASYAELAADLSIAESSAHGSVQRLRLAGLLRPESRAVNRHSLVEFLEHGVRYVFPARFEAPARGVPTAYSAPPLADEFVADDKVVWPSHNGDVLGQAVTPLYDKATELVKNCRQVYELLTLVDAIRIGQARERTAAVAKIKERLALAA
jgi:DNA-binding MarR family transcriptional regulator